jgi:acylphosphatase
MAFYAICPAAICQIVFHMDVKVRVHIFVSGRVQGVFYRESAKEKADELSVSGWVKNLKDRSVEAVLEGEKENVGKMIKWAGRGPILANVQDLKTDQEDFSGEFSSFDIR